MMDGRLPLLWGMRAGLRCAGTIQQPGRDRPEAEKVSEFYATTNAVAHQVLADDDGRAKGVSFFDAVTKQHYELESRAVVLAASTVESGRILFEIPSRASIPTAWGIRAAWWATTLWTA